MVRDPDLGADDDRDASTEISRILAAADSGTPLDFDRLVPLVYEELRAMAARHMAGERKDHTLSATGLVHEAFLRLTEGSPRAYAGKAGFYGAAAQAMRRILVDHARARAREKRGGGRRRAAIDLAGLAVIEDPATFLAVDEAIRRLYETDARIGSIVQLRVYAGLSLTETAEALGLPLRTVERDWAYARAWLFEVLR